MHPSPDLRGKRDQRQCVFEFESPFRGFVAEQFHSDSSSGPAAQGGQQRQRKFRYASSRFSCSPLVETERHKRCRIYGGKPTDPKSIERIQRAEVYHERLAFSFQNSHFRSQSLMSYARIGNE